jgi:enoyl-CoA hydratase
MTDSTRPVTPSGTDKGAVTLEVDRGAHIARITVRRVSCDNLMTSDMAAQLCGHLDAVERDDDVKVVVLAGEGEHLSAGRDPAESWDEYLRPPGGALRKHPSQRARLVAFDEDWWGPRGLYARVLRCTRITIVEARGMCYETGLYLALCSDLVVASPEARFGCPRWHNVGVDGDMSLLIAAVGLKRAKELMFCAVAWSAARAREYGLVDDVTPDVATRTAELAGMCASIMRDGIVTEKFAVFASLEKMGVGQSFAATTVVGASLSNIHFQPGEYNFLRDVQENGPDAALARSREDIRVLD